MSKGGSPGERAKKAHKQKHHFLLKHDCIEDIRQHIDKPYFVHWVDTVSGWKTVFGCRKCQGPRWDRYLNLGTWEEAKPHYQKHFVDENRV